MYTKKFPYKDYKGNPRNEEVTFNLEIREVILYLNEFKIVFDWQEAANEEYKEYKTSEVVEFYTAFENILLAAWGKISEDGRRFIKDEVFEFKDSKLFAVCMAHYLSNTEDTNTLVNGIMPEGMEALVKASQGNMQAMADNPDTPPNIKAEIARLQALQASEESGAATA